MERKLERCIRLRLVSLCTCVCTRVCVCLWVGVSDLSVSVATKINQQNIDQPLKIVNVVFVFNTSLGAFARWKAPSIPRCGRRRRRGNVKMPRRLLRWSQLSLSGELLLLLFSAFVFGLYVFCWPRGDSFRWDFWTVFSGVPEDFPNQNEGKPKRVSIGAHSVVVELSVCACFEPNVLFSGVHNFPLSIFSFRRMCMCQISPFFRRNRSAFPSFPLYWFDFWALPLYWYWFQRFAK